MNSLTVPKSYQLVQMLINHWHHIWEVHWGPIFSRMAHLFQTQWAISPNGFDFWAELCPWGGSKFDPRAIICAIFVEA